MRKGFFSFALFSVVLLAAPLPSQMARQRGTIYGESFVNLRSGPDLSYPSRSILSEGQEVRVEGMEGSWYLVSLPDGSRGYVHVTLVRFDAPADTRIAAPQAPPKPVVRPPEGRAPDDPAQATATEPTIEAKPPSAATPADIVTGEQLPNPFSPQFSAQISKGQPLPVVKVLEGREWDILGWLAVLACMFVLGWVCGGNYYLRRDRAQRTRIRF